MKIDMWIDDYRKEMKRQFRDIYGIVPCGGTDDEPYFEHIPDGTYPMTICGVSDNIRVVGEQIYYGDIAALLKCLRKPLSN